MSAGDIPRSEDSAANEVIEGHWPDDSETSAEDAAQEQLRLAGVLEEASHTAGQGRDYALEEMEGQAAEGIATKFGIHVGELSDRALQHQQISGWLSYLAVGITTAKQAINAAVQLHSPDHLAPKANAATKLFDPSARTQAQKDSSLQLAKTAVQEAMQTLESVKAEVALGISSGMKPKTMPSLKGVPSSKAGTEIGGPEGLPSNFPKAGAPGLTSPSPGLTSPVLDSPAMTTPAAGTPLAATGAEVPGATSAAAVPPPTLPADMGGTPASAASSLPSAADSGMGMGGMPMGGMPMGGMPMQPPQMPQMPTQTPGADIAKTAGDTIGKLAGGPGGGGAQALDSATLDKLLDANLSSNDDGGLTDSNGVVFKDGDNKLASSTGGGLGHNGASSTLTNPYSAANTNPTLNNPTLVGPPSPAAPTITAVPSAVSAPVTELSGDESIPQAGTYSASHAGVADAAGVTSASSGPHAGGPNGAGGQQGAGGALGAYPPGAGGFTPMPPPMGAMGAGAAMGAMPAASIPAVAAGGVAAAAAPMMVPTSTSSKPDPAASALFADRPGGANSGSERLAVLPPEHAVAHEHLAGVLKAFRNRPGMAWTTVKVAIGVFIYEEAGLPKQRVRYILATTDGLSLIPMDVKLPAGIELLGSLVDPTGSFVAEWSGNERPALKLVAAADSYPGQLGDLDYLVSNDTTDGTLAPAKVGEVVEVVQSKTQTEALIATHKASPATRSRVSVEWPRIAPNQAADALAAFGHAWRFDDGTPNDSGKATARLWAARWGAGNRIMERPDDYPAVLATYWYEEGMAAVELGRLDEAAYAANALADINP
ncbi:MULTISPECIES: WXG100-like domain-containing protein [Mycolicibacter]|uniref:ESX-1 secretion-associated protein EspK n=2 Tax=Mycolicibacter TaxID=1073531 RepID=A0ABU5XL65_9MYCO|nr:MULTISPECIES: hypothetical protein [unclassified Mycolicibacter]MEB3022918.1 hypothetical protein [Mycolicibacter sp. MYC098]MEB3034987.1 hypothetical protein [Mycolicibacter sp. MYC340]